MLNKIVALLMKSLKFLLKFADLLINAVNLNFYILLFWLNVFCVFVYAALYRLKLLLDFISLYLKILFYLLYSNVLIVQSLPLLFDSIRFTFFKLIYFFSLFHFELNYLWEWPCNQSNQLFHSIWFLWLILRKLKLKLLDLSIFCAR